MAHTRRFMPHTLRKISVPGLNPSFEKSFFLTLTLLHMIGYSINVAHVPNCVLFIVLSQNLNILLNFQIFFIFWGKLRYMVVVTIKSLQDLEAILVIYNQQHNTPQFYCKKSLCQTNMRAQLLNDLQFTVCLFVYTSIHSLYLYISRSQ